ncbi:MAG: IS4 family transposase [Thermoplasmata archaeon]
MTGPVRKALKNICSEISAATLVDEHSKKIDLLDHTVILVKSVMKNQELTDIAMENGISKSQLSKINMKRQYQLFVEMFYSLVYPYIMAHNYAIYRRFISIIGIDSTFIRTRIKESGKYRRQKTENGIKMHSASITFPFTLPLESSVTPANLNDSPEFEGILSGIDPDLLRESILTFDLGYYDLERFRELKNRYIRFVTRIKRNASYVVEKEYSHSKIIRFRNGLTLRLVSLTIEGKQRGYVTDIMDMPDIYIHYIYQKRWSIEIFFRTMKSYLKLDHIISKRINGIMVQIFTALIAYLVLIMIQDMLASYMGIPDMIRLIRHNIQLPLKSAGHAVKATAI